MKLLKLLKKSAEEKTKKKTITKSEKKKDVKSIDLGTETPSWKVDPSKIKV